jgi:hypothetical protein
MEDEEGEVVCLKSMIPFDGRDVNFHGSLAALQRDFPEFWALRQMRTDLHFV